MLIQEVAFGSDAHTVTLLGGVDIEVPNGAAMTEAKGILFEAFLLPPGVTATLRISKLGEPISNHHGMIGFADDRQVVVLEFSAPVECAGATL